MWKSAKTRRTRPPSAGAGADGAGVGASGVEAARLRRIGPPEERLRLIGLRDQMRHLDDAGILQNEIGADRGRRLRRRFAEVRLSQRKPLLPLPDRLHQTGWTDAQLQRAPERSALVEAQSVQLARLEGAEAGGGDQRPRLHPQLPGTFLRRRMTTSFGILLLRLAAELKAGRSFGFRAGRRSDRESHQQGQPQGRKSHHGSGWPHMASVSVF